MVNALKQCPEDKRDANFNYQIITCKLYQTIRRSCLHSTFRFFVNQMSHSIVLVVEGDSGEGHAKLRSSKVEAKDLKLSSRRRGRSCWKLYVFLEVFNFESFWLYKNYFHQFSYTFAYHKNESKRPDVPGYSKTTFVGPCIHHDHLPGYNSHHKSPR